jgi:hypothetical protein
MFYLFIAANILVPIFLAHKSTNKAWEEGANPHAAPVHGGFVFTLSFFGIAGLGHILGIVDLLSF